MGRTLICAAAALAAAGCHGHLDEFSPKGGGALDGDGGTNYCRTWALQTHFERLDDSDGRTPGDSCMLVESFGGGSLGAGTGLSPGIPSSEAAAVQTEILVANGAVHYTLTSPSGEVLLDETLGCAFAAAGQDEVRDLSFDDGSAMRVTFSPVEDCEAP